MAQLDGKELLRTESDTRFFVLDARNQLPPPVILDARLTVVMMAMAEASTEVYTESLQELRKTQGLLLAKRKNSTHGAEYQRIAGQLSAFLLGIEVAAQRVMHNR